MIRLKKTVKKQRKEKRKSQQKRPLGTEEILGEGAYRRTHRDRGPVYRADRAPALTPFVLG